MVRRQKGQLIPPGAEDGFGSDEKRVRPLPNESCEGQIDLANCAGLLDLDLQSHGTSSRFHLSQYDLRVGIGRIDKHGHPGGCGHQLAQKCQPFAASSAARKLTPVTLPLGRARLATMPALTGSSPTWETMGIIVVADLAASAAAFPAVASTATRRWANSAASVGSRSS